jgi:hypothetical protein
VCAIVVSAFAPLDVRARVTPWTDKLDVAGCFAAEPRICQMVKVDAAGPPAAPLTSSAVASIRWALNWRQRRDASTARYSRL